MQRYGDESVVVAIATLFNNNKMAGTLEQEAFEKNIDENEQKNPLPYNCLADFSTILSGINKNVLKSLLETLDKVYKPKSNEQVVISLVLQALLDTCKTKVVDNFIQSVLKLVQDCFHEIEAVPVVQRVVALERAFSRNRSNGVHYLAVKQSWEKLIFCSGQNVQLSSASVDVILQQILQHFWFTGSNSHTEDATVDLSNVDSLPTTTSNIQIDTDANQDNETIRDHAGWAIKRARDVIFKGQNELPAKATVKDDSPVIFGSKADALAVLSLLGEDKKQPDDSYRFRIYEHVIPFFIFLHKLAESLLSPENILREKENILKFCLDRMSTNKELRGRWNDLTPNSDMRTSVVVLQRIVTFFVKSKQQIIREKEGLKPNKNSVALRQQIRRLNKKCSTTSSTQTTTDHHIQTLRTNFDSSSLDVFLLHLKTLPPSEQEHILGNLQGRELGKILKSLGQPAFFGKKKEKQIHTLLEAVKGGMVCVKFPDEVSHSKMKPHTLAMKKEIYLYIILLIKKIYLQHIIMTPPPPPPVLTPFPALPCQ